jgi:hypothetical protein
MAMKSEAKNIDVEKKNQIITSINLLARFYSKSYGGMA